MAVHKIQWLRSLLLCLALTLLIGCGQDISIPSLPEYKLKPTSVNVRELVDLTVAQNVAVTSYAYEMDKVIQRAPLNDDTIWTSIQKNWQGKLDLVKNRYHTTLRYKNSMLNPIESYLVDGFSYTTLKKYSWAKKRVTDVPYYIRSVNVLMFPLQAINGAGFPTVEETEDGQYFVLTYANRSKMEGLYEGVRSTPRGALKVEVENYTLTLRIDKSYFLTESIEDAVLKATNLEYEEESERQRTRTIIRFSQLNEEPNIQLPRDPDSFLETLDRTATTDNHLEKLLLNG